MEIKEIEMTNFLSYYSQNKIEFAQGTTVIIGQNNTGKSKLFDAINFVLYNRIYETHKEQWITDSEEISEIVLNWHKKNEARSKNESSTEASVSMTIDDGTSIIKIERTINYELKDGAFKCISKNFILTEIDKFNQASSPYLNSDAEAHLRRYFSEHIKDFFLFQGEAASKIMKMGRGSNFSNAVKSVARLSIFEEAKELAEKYNDSVNRRLTKKSNKTKEQRQQYDNLSSEIEMKEKELEKYKTKYEEREKAVSEYSAELDSLDDKLSSLKEFEEYYKQKKRLEENSKKLERDISEAESYKTEIAEDAVFYKVKDKIANFKNFYTKLETKGDVPPSIPASEIKKALSYCRCTICNTDLSEGTEARAYAEKRLPKCDTDALGKYLRDLNSVISSCSEDIDGVPENLTNTIKQKQKLDSRKNDLINQKKQLQETLSEIQIDENQSSEKVREINETRSKKNRYEDLLERAKTEKATAKGSYDVYEKQIQHLKKERDNLIIGDDEVDEEDKYYLEASKRLSIAMNKLHEIANKTAYAEVEKKANEYYTEMTRDNPAIVGKIKIDVENSEIFTIDENNIRIRNINQGNRISIQLAVIAGILTVAQDQFSMVYPFVTDAPVSALGGANKLSTIKSMIGAFEQSIIIIKDDSSEKTRTTDELRNLIESSSDIGVAYELSLSEAQSVMEQYTVINKIK